eukprot:3112373-Rhodomonas_salina.1
MEGWMGWVESVQEAREAEGLMREAEEIREARQQLLRQIELDRMQQDDTIADMDSQLGMMMDNAEALLCALEQATPAVVSTAEVLVASLERDAPAVVAGAEALWAAKHRLEGELADERRAKREMEAAMQAQIDSVMDDTEAVLKSLEQAAPKVFATAEALVESLEGDARVVFERTNMLMDSREGLERELDEERMARQRAESARGDAVSRLQEQLTFLVRKSIVRMQHFALNKAFQGLVDASARLRKMKKQGLK